MFKAIWKFRYAANAFIGGLAWGESWAIATRSANDPALDPRMKRNPVDASNIEIGYALNQTE